MKKNLKIVSLAAAALLAVSPVVASGLVNPTAMVQADTTTATKPTTGVPYFVVGSKNTTVVTSGSIKLNKGENSIAGIVKAIKAKKYNVKVDGSATASLTDTDINNAVTQGLKDASINTSSTGSFDTPATPFTITLTVTADNGQKASLPITVTAYRTPTDYSMNPVITYNGVKYDHTQAISLADDAKFNYVPVNGSVDTSAITGAFSAVVSGNQSDGLGVRVDTSKVDTSKPGTYPVTVSATNANGHTTTLTFNLTVGAKNAKYRTAQSSDGSAIPVVSLNGNTVTTTQTTINSGTSVATFDSVTINNVSYTRINSADSNQWIETKYINGSQTTEESKQYRVMVTSKAYDKNGNYLGHNYDYNTNIDIVPTVVTINGKTYYKVAGKDEYVRVTNITGTPRRLRHNAYVYWSSYRRNWNGKIKYYRGQTVNTYGAAMTFRNGKKYYRIDGCSPSNKRYIKVANF